MPKEYTDPGPIQFQGVIQRNEAVDNNSLYIPFPYDLKETFGVGNLVPFKATFDGKVVYRGSLAKMGGPHPMILLRNDSRAQLRKGPGDTVEVLLELDDKPRQVVVPGDVLQALRLVGLMDYFTGLAYSHRKEYVRWIEEAKQDSTRRRRIAKMIDMLRETHG